MLFILGIVDFNSLIYCHKAESEPLRPIPVVPNKLTSHFERIVFKARYIPISLPRNPCGGVGRGG